MECPDCSDLFVFVSVNENAHSVRERARASALADGVRGEQPSRESS